MEDKIVAVFFAKTKKSRKFLVLIFPRFSKAKFRRYTNTENIKKQNTHAKIISLKGINRVPFLLNDIVQLFS